jgi:hypothetical protein
MIVSLNIAQNSSDAYSADKTLDLERIPSIGEEFALDFTKVYKVVRVVTNNFEDADTPYELYLMKI